MTTSTSPIGTRPSTEARHSSTTTNVETTQERVHRVGIERITEYAAVGSAVGIVVGGPIGVGIGAAAGAAIGTVSYGYTWLTS
ncbi:MAG: hypothetical protein KR126chlam5_00919 [Candidatus Anoxychlamydiales bacterium]|nr:hypothetical protein [Candidatus Anoxychlamydiales bacterium]